MRKGIACLVLCLIIAVGIVACGGGGGSSSPSSGSSTDTTAPSVPTGLLASAITSSTLSLGWTASTDDVGVAGYIIFRNGVQIITSITNSFSDTGLSSSTTYTYAVAAYDAAGNISSRSSDAVIITLTDGTIADTQAPTVPTNLIATAVSSTQIDLSWSVSTDNVGVAGYEVWRGSTKISSVTTTSYRDNGLVSSSSFTYSVKSFDAAGNVSVSSNSATATTLTAVSIISIDVSSIQTFTGIQEVPSYQFVAVGHYLDGTISDVSNLCVWSSTNDTGAGSVSATGLFTGTPDALTNPSSLMHGALPNTWFEKSWEGVAYISASLNGISGMRRVIVFKYQPNSSYSTTWNALLTTDSSSGGFTYSRTTGNPPVWSVP